MGQTSSLLDQKRNNLTGKFCEKVPTIIVKWHRYCGWNGGWCRHVFAANSIIRYVVQLVFGFIIYDLVFYVSLKPDDHGGEPKF